MPRALRSSSKGNKKSGSGAPPKAQRKLDGARKATAAAAAANAKKASDGAAGDFQDFSKHVLVKDHM